MVFSPASREHTLEIDFCFALQCQEFTALFTFFNFDNFSHYFEWYDSDPDIPCVPLSRAAILLHTLVLSPIKGESHPVSKTPKLYGWLAKDTAILSHVLKEARSASTALLGQLPSSVSLVPALNIFMKLTAILSVVFGSAIADASNPQGGPFWMM